MYIYNLGYYSHEENEYIQLYHKDKFTQKKFEEIVMNSAAKILEKEVGKIVSFEDILSDVVENLIKSYGFIKVDFNAEFSVFGWPNLLDKDDWKGDRDDLLDKLTDFIKNKSKNNSPP